MIRNRKLKMGMVGGGSGAFIGGIHRMAAQLDGHIELVCGVFSSDSEKSIAFGKEIYLKLPGYRLLSLIRMPIIQCWFKQRPWSII